jgi:hypothetical protein
VTTSALTSRMAQPAAIAVAVLFIAVVGFQVWWASGGSWGLSAAWGGAHDELSTGLRVASVLSALFFVVGVIVVLCRVGYWVPPVPFKVFWWAAWVFVAILALSTLANFASSSDWERFLNAPLALISALLCLIVVRSDNPHSPIGDDSSVRQTPVNLSRKAARRYPPGATDVLDSRPRPFHRESRTLVP